MTAWPAVMVTGHRPQSLAPSASRWVRKELARLAVKLRDEHTMTTGISGMALGSDMWWADAVLKAGVRLWAHIPFPQQPNPWTEEDKAEWHRLFGLSAWVNRYGDAYDVRLLHARNDGMLAAADAVVAVLDPAKTKSGTASVVAKATSLGLPIIRVNPVTRATTLKLPSPA